MSAALTLALFAPTTPARAADECGAGSTASAGTTRFGTYASGTVYALGTVIKHTVSSTERLYRRIGTGTGAPGGTNGTTAMNGWSANLTAGTDYASDEVVCNSSDTPSTGYDSTIDYDDADLAIIYNRTGTANFIRHSGAGGEIHVQQGTITKTGTESNGAAVGILTVAGNTNPLSLTVASGVTISNTDTDSNNNYGVEVRNLSSSDIYVNVAGDVTAVGDAIRLSVDTQPAGGVSRTIALTASGNTTATGTNRAAIDIFGQGRSSGNIGIGRVVVNLTGGRHRATGSQTGTTNSALRVDSSALDPHLISISSGTTLEASGSANRAIFINSINTTTNTPRTIGSGNWMGSRVTNRGTIIGDFSSRGGADLFENHGTFTGRIEDMGGSGDEVRNAGAMTLDGDSTFGTGTDSFINTGTLIIDHAANSDEQVDFSGLETFTQTSGTIRFVYDFSNTAPTVTAANALLDLGGATTATFTAGVIEVVAASGSTLSSGTVLPLITQTSSGGLTSSQVMALSSSSGTLAITSGVLQITLADRVCGQALASRMVSTPGAANMQVSCASATANAYSSGITATNDRLAILYNTAASGTPFISHTGSGGEIHIQSGTITKPSGSSGNSAVFLSNTTGSRDLYLTTLSGTTVANEDGRNLRHGISVSSLSTHTGALHLNIAGDVSIADNTSAVSNAAIRGGISNASSSADINATVSGNTTTLGSSDPAINLFNSGSGNVHLDITGGTHRATGSFAADVATVRVRAADTPTSNDATSNQVTLDISSGATVTTLNEDNTASSNDQAIFFSGTNTDTTTARTIGSGDWTGNRASNAGTIVGDFSSGAGDDLFENAATGRFTGDISLGGGVDEIRTASGSTFTGDITMGAGNDVFNNAGTFIGDITMGAGDDSVSNSGRLTLNDDIDFGAGSSDSFTNTGRLVIDHAAEGGQVSISGLETFTQTSGTIHFVFNFNNAAPTVSAANALLNLGGATTATFTAGAIEVAAARGSTLSAGAVLPLITRTSSGGLTASQIRALTSSSGALAVSSSGVLQITLPTSPRPPVEPPPTGPTDPGPTDPGPTTPTPLDAAAAFRAALGSYEALLQTAWYADRAFSIAMRSQTCYAVLLGEKNWCAWGRTGGRFAIHAPSGAAEYDELVYTFATGAHILRDRWFMRLGMGIEVSALETELSGIRTEADINRYLGGAQIGTRGGRSRLNLDFNGELRFGYSSQEIETAFGGNFPIANSSSNLLTIAATGGVEKQFPIAPKSLRLPKSFGALYLTTGADLGLVSRAMDGFSAARGRDSLLTVAETSDILGIGRVYAEAQTDYLTRYRGQNVHIVPHLRTGIDFFLGDPSATVEGTSGGNPHNADGEMGIAVMDVSLGGSYRRGNLEMDFAYEGAFALTGETSLHNILFRLNYAF